MTEKGTQFFSQNGEDYLLWRFFEGYGRGYYIDIGAFDGIHLSNTYSFERKGWQGICVEAHPAYYRMLERNRPSSKCLHFACVGKRNQGEVTFFIEEMGLLSSLVDTEQFREDVRSRYRKRGLLFKGFRSKNVPAATVDEILERYLPDERAIDFISIDVEGAELDVLEGFDVVRYSPRIILVEANTKAIECGIIAHLSQAAGYQFAGRLVENLFFVKTEEDLDRIRSIKIACRIEKQSHPLGDAYSTSLYLEGKVVDAKAWNSLKW